MPKNKRRKPANENPDIMSIAVKALIGSLINIIVFFALTAVFSLICWKSDADSACFKYLIFVCGAFSGLIGGFCAVRPFRKNGIVIGAASSAPALLVILLTASIISRTGISAAGWITALITALFSAVGGILSANKRK